MGYDILVFGAGSLARVFCFTMAAAAKGALRIHVLARSKNSVDELVRIANARAATLSAKVEFSGDTIDWTRAGEAGEKLDQIAPRLILQTASLQSPWALVGDDSAWNRMVREGGFGVTLPLQAMLLTRVAREIKRTGARTLLVNACYPDAVNPIVHHLGLPITCGIGNVGILNAICRGNDRTSAPNDWRIIAHHWHLSRLRRDDRESSHMPWVWKNGTRVNDAAPLFSGLSGIRGQALNNVTGCQAVEVVQALLSPASRVIHVPGPNGLPGGYPVAAANGEVTLNLPDGISAEDAIDFNGQCAANEGTTVIDNNGFIAFGEKARAALAAHAPSLANGFAIRELDDVVAQFMDLRARLNGA